MKKLPPVAFKNFISNVSKWQIGFLNLHLWIHFVICCLCDIVCLTHFNFFFKSCRVILWKYLSERYLRLVLILCHSWPIWKHLLACDNIVLCPTLFSVSVQLWLKSNRNHLKLLIVWKMLEIARPSYHICFVSFLLKFVDNCYLAYIVCFILEKIQAGMNVSFF